ncbi:MAG: PilN domain-containing protein [Desulfomicrobium sp.]|jgi:type IV pilus assembly protein PilN|nr:PilN domain-containing protein [Pseudomonadota bacterium]MBV1710435.1 PilN domain-containing protein [Desulfomicrobium sp.]MBU4570056.1 PilN domain-containing protein [Pseudomonadota bacterium]MBU4593974.1 PilN domain-containing protein [Pseudomonadota bacterium]MBV1721107.1 PilN domain-containing protein [Desulfomicrobium sp.]
MIKINLLPQQKRTKSTNVEKSLVFFVLGVVVLFGSVFGVDYYFSSQLGELNAAVTAKTQTKTLLEKEVAKVNQTIQALQDIEGRIKIIKDVRLRQGLPVKYIDEIVINMPENKLWVETFNIDANGNIALSGVALDNQAFVTYVERLRLSKYIASVDTRRTSRRAIDGLGLVSFECSVKAQEYFENINTNGTTNG